MITQTAATISTFLTEIAALFTQILTWLGAVIDVIEAEPILLIFVAIVVVRMVIGIVRRWIPGRV